MGALRIVTGLYWHLCRRADELAGHAADVGFPVVGRAALLIRAAKSRSVHRTEVV